MHHLGDNNYYCYYAAAVEKHPYTGAACMLAAQVQSAEMVVGAYLSATPPSHPGHSLLRAPGAAV
jgi:hypothetical protein